MIRDLAVTGLVACWFALAPTQGAAQERAEDLAARLDEISATLRRLEAQLEQVIEEQADLAAAVAALNDRALGMVATVLATPPAPADAAQAARQATQPGRPITQPGRPITQAGRPGAEIPSVLEIEVLGGVSGDELAAIVDWVRKVHASHRSSRIVVEPVMPFVSADPAGQRRRLMNEAGRVIDHVFEELNQRVEISTLVSEPVPGPRLRLALSEV